MEGVEDTPAEEKLLAGAKDVEVTSRPTILSNSVTNHPNQTSPSNEAPSYSSSQSLATGSDQDTFDVTDHRPNIEISIPSLPVEIREQYEETKSDVVERVLALTSSGKHGRLTVEFTDGKQHMITMDEIGGFENGAQALAVYFMDAERESRKRKHEPNDDWEGGSSSDDTDLIGLDVGDGAEESVTSRHDRTRRALSRLASKPTLTSNVSDSEDSDVVLNPVRRSSRKRQTRFPEASLQEPNKESRSRSQVGDDEDGLFMPVISDIPGRGRGAKRGSRRSRLLRPQRAVAKAPKSLDDSDIEFEQPRRSSRATRNIHYTQDDMDMDEESFYRADDGPVVAPRVVAVKEHFRPLPPKSRFASVHMDVCNTCRSSNDRSQIVCCQGCSYVYHKHCIGPRSAREHLVTKIGEADFVLQCQFCIESHQKKDNLGPRRAMCQACSSNGRSCAPFSKRQTARQEEKLREKNGGIDPVTTVSGDLVNNADNVLFRCCDCHRAWHQDHLPQIGSPRSTPDPTLGALKDYSIDWQCNECTSAQQKIDRIVAWRTKAAVPNTPAVFMQLSDDDKEYLIKWDTMSYFHCTWVPGAWMYGAAAGVMRHAFAKRAGVVDLFRVTEKEAIPEEYLTIDIILRVKLDPVATRGRSKEEEEGNISHITKVLAKFQGLGYDDVVWDIPPPKDSGDLYTAFELAYRDYLSGKYFQHSSQTKMSQRLKAFKDARLEGIPVQPAGLKRGKLMGYQLEGLNWLVSNFHCGRSVILADEMGLGKTVQVVALVTYLVQETPQCWPFLVSVPNATCPNWRREFKQWAPDLRVVTYHGGKEPQDLAYKHELFPQGTRDMTAHVVIMSYDSTQDPRTRELFSSVRWAGLVVDEGQRLKNDSNLLYHALRAMKIPFRLLLTGTPLQNNKRELFNLIQFIDHTQNAGKLDEQFEVLDKETLPKLHEKIRPYFLRRTKAGVLKFLPPMSQIILPVTMTVIQEKLSKSIMTKNPQLIKAIFANGKVNKKERGNLNNILVQLRKCLCHPFMYSEAIEEKHDNPVVVHRNLVEASAKLLLLEVMLPKLKERGHRVLLFSQFLHQLDIMEDFLNGIGCQYRRLDGNISSLEKQRRIDAFNEPDSPIFAFLLSTRAGGVGINLATADTVIILDPDFNPHQDIQALSRAHRIGQKRKVLCFQLMTKDTVEERIMQIGKKKMALDHALIESMDDDELEGDDLESILKHGAQALFTDDYQKGAIKYDGPSVDKLLDRSQSEQAAVDEEGSAETQFSYAKVWANEKATLEDVLVAAAEDEAPEPISSSVWDKILAEREAEAERQALANQEKLGRGGRRRTMNNYKPDILADDLQDGDAANVSDSSDDFAGAYYSSSSDEDAVQEGKTKKSSPTKLKSTTATPRKKVKTATKVDKRIQQKTITAGRRRETSITPSRKPRSKATGQQSPTETNSKVKSRVKSKVSPPKSPNTKQSKGPSCNQPPKSANTTPVKSGSSKTSIQKQTPQFPRTPLSPSPTPTPLMNCPTSSLTGTAMDLPAPPCPVRILSPTATTPNTTPDTTSSL
ncbi:hypothetical protein QQS21_005931 [Conoideocrella luteorostrata]|uniref:Chromatin remodeling factor mit1 n=1 Tax=Conoideocrella luteorostrata TaxID=1105319 RepID=A0AAJ0CNU7_9HYPO|nr:hypothetical protein QQS21_005931 [Conoideocrella luteorostrata]